jgi:hypothetical protein
MKRISWAWLQVVSGRTWTVSRQVYYAVIGHTAFMSGDVTLRPVRRLITGNQYVVWLKNVFAPWSEALLDRLIDTHLAKISPHFNGRREFIVFVTRDHHWTQFWDSCVLSTRTYHSLFLIHFSNISSWGSIPGRSKGFFLYPLCPDRLWGPPSLLSNGYRGPFSRR